MTVGHCMIPPEDSGGDEVGDDHVNAVVLMSHEDTDHPRDTEEPTGPVVPPHPLRRVYNIYNIYHLLILKIYLFYITKFLF